MYKQNKYHYQAIQKTIVFRLRFGYARIVYWREFPSRRISWVVITRWQLERRRENDECAGLSERGRSHHINGKARNRHGRLYPRTYKQHCATKLRPIRFVWLDYHRFFDSSLKWPADGWNPRTWVLCLFTVTKRLTQTWSSLKCEPMWRNSLTLSPREKPTSSLGWKIGN